MEPLLNISPIDGRYSNIVLPLQNFFSEYAYIKHRLLVEIEYVLFLTKFNFLNVGIDEIPSLTRLVSQFNISECKKIKKIEDVLHHDVKSIEYYIKERVSDNIKPFIHFGLTSQDINNTTFMLIIKEYITSLFNETIGVTIKKLKKIGDEYIELPMLSYTHGQVASPTTLGKEIMVFYERLEKQMIILSRIEYSTKFGGCNGNMNAHYVAFPEIDWKKELTIFVNNLGLNRNMYTTQIDHYDNYSEIFDCLKRINTIFIDFCRDMWQYISMDYFRQKISKEQVGSSTMPHKINPINFENAEGNFMLSNNLLSFLSEKLPISRLQRDLTDSTTIRNIGLAFSYMFVGIKSLEKGLDKLDVNEEKIKKSLDDNWVVICEAIQTVLKKYGMSNGYELLKDFSRNYEKINKESIMIFINNLDISDNVKEELFNITPFNYTGITK